MEHRIHINRDLVQKVKGGDKRAFQELVELLMKPAYYHALAILNNHEDAVELSQRAFIRTWTYRKRIDPGRPFYTWFYTVLKNLCLNHHRNQSRRKETAWSRVDSWIEPESSLNPSEGVLKKEEHRLLQESLEKLDVADRELIVMKDLENYRYKDISEVLGIPPGTVMSRLYNARKRLKTILEEAGYEYS